MRKVTFRVANSLDNYIAREDGSVDWILHSDDANSSLADFWKTIDTVLWGRKTYDIVKGRMPAYTDVKNYVFSRTLKESADKGVEIVNGDAVDFVRNLKNQEGKAIFVMGGGELAKSLFEGDLIDEVGVNIHPILLGSGIPLFHEMKGQINLKLLECTSLKNGCVLLSYRVKR
ncbi:MAG TPA: dihydrofolate reductase family protein [Pyrinomonadaceae bacterium]|jgi:dihydrofolate reductase